MRASAITLALAVAVASTARADELTLRPNEPLTAEVKEEKTFLWPGYAGDTKRFALEVPVRLKAGQKIDLTATVVGTNRTVQLALVDPSGKFVETTYYGGKPKTERLVVPEVSSTGVYRVVVASNRIGEFTLTARFAGEADEIKTLEAQVERLRRELKDAEERLERARKKE
jgi:HAMP domain-containing protein